MALPSSGEIKFSQIATEFGDTVPFTMSSWYKGGYYVSNIPAQNTNIPTSGTINLKVFLGAQRPSGTAAYTTAQTNTPWTVPSGIFSVTVNACGGGGGGGAADGGTNFSGYGGAGGGSNLKGNVTFAVTPGQVLNVTVGDGGPANGGQGTYGGQSIVTSTGISYTADGGMGGQNYVSNSGVSAWAGQGAYGANYATATTSRTFNPGVSFNGGSDGGRGGNAPNYTPGLKGNPGKVYIYY